MNLDNDLEVNFRQVTCKRGIDANTFQQGIMDFDFSVSGKNAWLPGYSYFRIELELTGSGGVPTVKDNVALADCVGGCLFNNCYFRAGGQDVSNITQYVPQAGILKHRLDKSGSWMKSIGRDLNGCDPSFARRMQKMASDGSYAEDGLTKVVKPDAASATVAFTAPNTVVPQNPNNTIVYLTQGLLTLTPGNNPNVTWADYGVGVGDTVVLTGIPFVIDSVVDGVNLATSNTSVVADIGTDANWYAEVNDTTRNGKNKIYLMYQPPIGIFDLYQGIGSGDFKLQLNPNASYKKACVEALQNLTVGGGPGEYDINVQNIQLYICQVKKDMPSAGILPLSLMEMQIINKTLSTSTGTQQLDFTVPPSTQAITIFVQAGSAGTDNRLPPTKFKVLGNIDEKLESIQVTYGNVTKPSTLYSSEYGDSTNKMVQRWLESTVHSGKINNEGGTESLTEFLDRGSYYTYDFSRDKNDTSTYCNVQIKFSEALPPNSQLFLVSHYSRQVSIEFEQGYITQVTSINR